MMAGADRSAPAIIVFARYGLIQLPFKASARFVAFILQFPFRLTGRGLQIRISAVAFHGLLTF
jgi:hypothetical protein